MISNGNGPESCPMPPHDCRKSGPVLRFDRPRLGTITLEEPRSCRNEVSYLNATALRRNPGHRGHNSRSTTEQLDELANVGDDGRKVGEKYSLAIQRFLAVRSPPI